MTLALRSSSWRSSSQPLWARSRGRSSAPGRAATSDPPALRHATPLNRQLAHELASFQRAEAQPR